MSFFPPQPAVNPAAQLDQPHRAEHRPDLRSTLSPEPVSLAPTYTRGSHPSASPNMQPQSQTLPQSAFQGNGEPLIQTATPFLSPSSLTNPSSSAGSGSGSGAGTRPSPAFSEILASPALSAEYALPDSFVDLNAPVPECWGHRGASADYPENTRASFLAACEAGADGIETDIHVTADNVLVLFHDPNLGRTTDGEGRIDKLTWHGHLEHVRTKATPVQPIPLFTEVLDILMRPANMHVKLNIDCKVEGDPWRLFSLMKGLIETYPSWETALAPRLVLGIWHPKFIAPAMHILPYLPRFAISMSLLQTSKYFLETCQGFSILFAALNTSQGAIFRHECKRRQKEICVWTVNDEEDMKACVRWGVKAVITDKPALFEAVKREIERDRVLALSPPLHPIRSMSATQLKYLNHEEQAHEELQYLEREGGKFDDVLIPTLPLKPARPAQLMH